MENLNDRIMFFINNVRPRLVMGELQAIAALAKYLESGNAEDIPGFKKEEVAYDSSLDDEVESPECRLCGTEMQLEEGMDSYKCPECGEILEINSEDCQ